MRTSRVEAFSDGIFAIAATLLTLELRVPREQADLTRTLADQWPVYAAYLVSFLTIGIIWVNHHTLLEHIRRVDRRFLYLNLLLLLSVAVVPFPTAVVGEYIQDARGATAALVLYGLVGLLIAMAFASLFFYATHDGRSCATRTRDAGSGRRGDCFPLGSPRMSSASRSRSCLPWRASRCTGGPRCSTRCRCCRLARSPKGSRGPHPFEGGPLRRLCT